jgi:endonuclease I
MQQETTILWCWFLGIQKLVNSTYWYPGDEWKGDVARMVMYMYVRYGNQQVTLMWVQNFQCRYSRYFIAMEC